MPEEYAFLLQFELRTAESCPDYLRTFQSMTVYSSSGW